MAGPDINQIETRLAEVLQKERQEAIKYAVLTVLCTPFVAAVVGIIGFVILLPILRNSGVDLTVLSIFTSLNCFLALMLVLAFRYINIDEDSFKFDQRWIASLVIFFCLLYITYVTGLLYEYPIIFVSIYIIFGFLILVLLGHIVMTKMPFVDFEHNSKCYPLESSVLCFFGLIATAYGEIFWTSWLWSMPSQDKIKSCAWILCKLTLEDELPIDSDMFENQNLFLLSRLQLVYYRDNKLQLTPKGQKLIS